MIKKEVIMPKFKISWRREEYGECIITAPDKESAENNAEIGLHKKIKSTGFGGSEGWTIFDVKAIK